MINEIEQDKFRAKYRTKSMRLDSWDYSLDGAYFITICTKNRECVFGDVKNDEMLLNEIGEIAKTCWEEIPQHFPYVVLDAFVIMPNHVHAVLFIDHDVISTPVSVETKDLLSLRGEHNRLLKKLRGTSKTIGSIIRGFKIGVTKWVNCNTNVSNIWQTNYYDHIVRNEAELNRIRHYIIDNPLNWEKDKNDLRNLYC